MNYTYRQIEDTYVVWFAPANRFMQMQEPAFRVLEDWTNKLPELQIMWNCAREFKLRMGDARRFVIEVTGQLQSLVSSYKLDQIVNPSGRLVPLPDPSTLFTKYYGINGQDFRFRYSHPDLEDLIHPGFVYLENDNPEDLVDHSFDLFYSGNQIFLQMDGQHSWSCPDTASAEFVGLVYLQLLNCIHHSTDDQWMGAVHASAVTAGKGAVLFTAPSGSGKSTFAAMLMNESYKVLSDDFSPISLNDTKVYPFPEGISVKDRSLELLQSYFPSLGKSGESLPYDVREIFLPISNGALPAPAPVTAIVFLQYDPNVEVMFNMIPNIDAMDRFLLQLWLPPTNEVATRFMDWYFQIPCYTLNYSDTAQAIKTISKLFES